MTTDHTREALAETVLSARWPDGSALALTSKTAAFVADAILASPWLAAHVAAVVAGKDTEIERLRADAARYADGSMKVTVQMWREVAAERDEARAALAAVREQGLSGRSVTLAEIERQREHGWPDFHPEDFCHRCGGRNISWWIDSQAWNSIMRPDGPDSQWLWNEIICPQCFAELFEAQFPNTAWRLSMDPDTAGARSFAARIARSTTDGGQ